MADYSLMASIYTAPLPRYRWLKAAAVALVCVAALSTAYWFWEGGSGVVPEQSRQQPPPHTLQWQPLQISHQYPAGEAFILPLPTLERTPEGTAVEVTLDGSGDTPEWLQLDRERLRIRGTAPLVTEDQTYRLVVRAHAEHGSDSRLLVLLTIKGQPDQVAPKPRLPGHWAW